MKEWAGKDQKGATGKVVGQQEPGPGQREEGCLESRTEGCLWGRCHSLERKYSGLGKLSSTCSNCVIMGEPLNLSESWL